MHVGDGRIDLNSNSSRVYDLQWTLEYHKASVDIHPLLAVRWNRLMNH